MPRLVPIPTPETPALLALRRTLWQLAFVGIVAAAILTRIAPDAHALAAWCVLVPLSALAVHFRHPLLDLLRLHRGTRSPAGSHRRQTAQARRASGAKPSSPRRPARARPLQGPLPVRRLARR